MIRIFSGDISDTSRHLHPVCDHYLQMSSIPALPRQSKEKPKTHLSSPERQTALSSLASISGHRAKKVQQSSGSLQSHCEYLSLVLPEYPSDPIQILGKSSLTGQYFELRAGLILSVIRVLSNRLDNSLTGGAPTHFDILLMEASDFLRALKPRSKMRSKPRTSRWLIKALLRLEQRRLELKK